MTERKGDMTERGEGAAELVLVGTPDSPPAPDAASHSRAKSLEAIEALRW